MLPIVSFLVSNGLGLVANAILAKGKEAIEKKTGLDLSRASLTPEEMTKLKQFELEHEATLMQLRIEDNRLETELRKAEIAADLGFMEAAQETGRIEVQSADEYVRRTRPRLARLSFYSGLGYVVCTGVVFPIASALTVLSLPDLDAYILGAIYSPCLAYVGVRSVEAFSRTGKR